MCLQFVLVVVSFWVFSVLGANSVWADVGKMRKSGCSHEKFLLSLNIEH